MGHAETEKERAERGHREGRKRRIEEDVRMKERRVKGCGKYISQRPERTVRIKNNRESLSWYRLLI